MSPGGRTTIPLVLVALVGALSVVVFHPLIGLPIAGVALAALVYREQTTIALAASLLGAVLAGFLAHATVYVVVFPLIGVPVPALAPYVFTALVAASLLLVGPGAVALLRRRSMLATAGVLAVALTTLQAGALAAFASGAGTRIGEYVSTAAARLVTETGAAEELGSAVASMWPGALVTMNGFTAMLVVIGVVTVGVRSGMAPRHISPLATLDLDPRTVVLPIAAVALLAAGRFQGGADSTLTFAGQNLLVVARWVFFGQGLAVFAGLYARAKVARPVRAFGFVLLGITEAFIPAVSLMGLADIWLNVRRLPRDTSAAGPSGATRDEN
jgi:hypothetical protein